MNEAVNTSKNQPIDPLLVRITHGTLAIAILALIGSSLTILNTHSTFYWGESANPAARSLHLPLLPAGLTLMADWPTRWADSR